MLEHVSRVVAILIATLLGSGIQLAHADGARDMAGTSAKRGGVLFLQCRACHEVRAGQPHKVGPNLHGIMDRKAGTAEGYVYTKALAASGLVWDADTLNRWLEHPGAVVPGTSMAFAGIANAADRLAVIAYLEQATR